MGNVARIGETKNACRICLKSQKRRQIGKLGGVDRINVTYDGEQGRVLANTIISVLKFWG
jgi:hypothetical protein